jgi:hypothetical protein
MIYDKIYITFCIIPQPISALRLIQHVIKIWYAFLVLITPYIRMLDSDWLIAVIFFLQIQALHCEFAEFLLHVGVFA